VVVCEQERESAEELGATPEQMQVEPLVRWAMVR